MNEYSVLARLDVSIKYCRHKTFKACFYTLMDWEIYWEMILMISDTGFERSTLNCTERLVFTTIIMYTYTFYFSLSWIIEFYCCSICLMVTDWSWLRYNFLNKLLQKCRYNSVRHSERYIPEHNFFFFDLLFVESKVPEPSRCAVILVLNQLLALFQV